MDPRAARVLAALEQALTSVVWVPLTPTPPAREGEPYATHEGLLVLDGFGPLPVYRLSTGARVFEIEELDALLGTWGEDGHA